MNIADQAEALVPNPIEAQTSERDFTMAPPKADPRMFYGLVGEVARQGTSGREPDPASVAMAFMSWLSSAVGPYHFLQVGDQSHALVINGIHAGRSARAAKGESWALPKRISRAVSEMMDTSAPTTDDEGTIVTPQLFAGRTHTGGLSTGEGLAALVHDGFVSGKTEHAPIHDKRLLIIEAEFARLLEQGRRDGNTLSPIIRDLYDGGSIQPATKSAGIWATEPHIVIHGAITPYELRTRMGDNAAHNGLLNRFLIIFAERKELVAFPEPTPDEVVHRLAFDTQEVIKFARGRYPETKYAKPIQLNAEAREIYRQAYPELKGRASDNPIVTSLLERRAPITMRLAGLFALTDQTTVINADHMQAALTWSRFHRDSVNYIFSQDQNLTQRIESEKRSENKQKLLAGIRVNQWITRTKIMSQLFGNRIKAADLTTALEDLLTDGLIEMRETPKQNGIGTMKEYARTAKHANNAKEGIRTPSEPLRNTANHAKQGHDEPNKSMYPAPHHSHVSHHSQNFATAETRTRTHVTHHSYDSQPTQGNNSGVIV